MYIKQNSLDSRFIYYGQIDMIPSRQEHEYLYKFPNLHNPQLQQLSYKI